jgi:hypothetical protein
MDGIRDIFLARLNGQSVRCESVEDAVAVKRASAILEGRDVMGPISLERLAGILVRYQCANEARRLTRLAARQRAAELLVATAR